jgi:hypothetical protein
VVIVAWCVWDLIVLLLGERCVCCGLTYIAARASSVCNFDAMLDSSLMLGLGRSVHRRY